MNLHSRKTEYNFFLIIKLIYDFLFKIQLVFSSAQSDILIIFSYYEHFYIPQMDFLKLTIIKFILKFMI